MNRAPKFRANEFDPEVSGMILPPSSAFLPPPAYNPSMTMPQEPRSEFTVVHQPGKKLFEFFKSHKSLQFH